MLSPFIVVEHYLADCRVVKGLIIWVVSRESYGKVQTILVVKNMVGAQG